MVNNLVVWVKVLPKSQFCIEILVFKGQNFGFNVKICQNSSVGLKTVNNFGFF